MDRYIVPASSSVHDLAPILVRIHDLPVTARAPAEGGSIPTAAGEREGTAIGAVGIFDLADLMGQSTMIRRRQVCDEDPSPLPTGSPGAKR